jgi:hypothetical protein
MDKKQEILRILQEIRTTEYSTIQSIDLLLEYGFRLTQYMAFSGEAMAEAKEQLHDKRSNALLRVDRDLKKNAGALLIKDYINDLCSKENAFYELCERCNRACTHSVDLVRTAVSALKEEQRVSNYSNTRN